MQLSFIKKIIGETRSAAGGMQMNHRVLLLLCRRWHAGGSAFSDDAEKVHHWLRRMYQQPDAGRNTSRQTDG